MKKTLTLVGTLICAAALTLAGCAAGSRYRRPPRKPPVLPAAPAPALPVLLSRPA